MSEGRMRQTVAVTGATGFLGSNLTERLLRNGYKVRILARDGNKARQFEGRVDKTVVADINDRNSLAELVKNADAVIHLVSNFRTASGPPESYSEINVQGTDNVLQAAKAAGVKRFIHCSTIGVHGHVESTPLMKTLPTTQAISTKKPNRRPSSFVAKKWLITRWRS